jgi:hypothetical protein
MKEHPRIPVGLRFWLNFAKMACTINRLGRILCVLAVLVLPDIPAAIVSAAPGALIYYVSSSTGSDAYNGLST